MVKIKKSCHICGYNIEHDYSFWHEIGGEVKLLNRQIADTKKHDFLWICEECLNEFGWRISQSILEKAVRKINFGD